MKFTIKMNRNGLKIVSVTSKKGGFTIQTNGTLPETHKMELGVLEGDDWCRSFIEVGKHVNGMKNKRQAGILTSE